MAYGNGNRRNGKYRTYRTKKQKEDNKLVTRKEVKRIVDYDSESKFLITPISYAPVSFDPQTTDVPNTLQQLNVMPQGTDIGERIGLDIWHKRLELNYSIYNNDAPFGRVRCIVFWWRSEVGNQPTPSAILANSQAAGPPNLNMDSVYNYRNRNLYTILYDKVTLVTSGEPPNVSFSSDYPDVAQTGGGTPQVHRRKVIKLKNKKGRYFDATASAPMIKGALYVMFIGDQSDASNFPHVTMQSCLWYKDE